MEGACRRLRNSAAAVRMKTLFATGVFRVAALVLMLVGLGSAPAYAQTFSCANDAQGANDVPGQKDLTRMCVATGSGVYELYNKWMWDFNSLSGGNIG